MCGAILCNERTTKLKTALPADAIDEITSLPIISFEKSIL